MRRLFMACLPVLALATAAQADTRVTATWYGNELRGHRTASGAVFNPDGMTAAHRSLPFGTCLVVGNPRTGKSVRVKVNDRGPFTGRADARSLARRGAGDRHEVDPSRNHAALLGSSPPLVRPPVTSR